MIIVILNVIIMALDGNLIEDPKIKAEIYKTTYLFNSVFILEFIIKIIGLGPLSKILSNNM